MKLEKEYKSETYAKVARTPYIDGILRRNEELKGDGDEDEGNGYKILPR